MDPQLITPRPLFRTIEINPKITTAQLRVEVAPELSKATIHRYLKSSIQKWRYKNLPFLDDEKAAERLHWAMNTRPLDTVRALS
jgi:hypothetical protein